MCDTPRTPGRSTPGRDYLDNFPGFASTVAGQRVTRTKISPEGIRRRKDRGRLLDALRPWTKKDRLRQCCRTKLPYTPRTEIRYTPFGYGFVHGVKRCGYAQFCPVCAAKIADRRAAEIKRAVDLALRLGHGIYMLTLTVPHGSWHSLSELRKTVERAFRHMTGGRAWVNDRAEYGILGVIRTFETTIGIGLNGWHPHLHVLIITDKPLSDPSTLHDRFFSRWSDFVVRSGLEAPNRDASKLDPITEQRGIGRYLSKVSVSVSHELTRSDLKKGRKGHWTPWQLLWAACETEEDQYREKWHEWEEAMSGVRLVTWSRGLKSYFGIDDLTDGEIAEQEEAFTHVRTLSDDEWHHLRDNPDDLSLLFTLIQTDGEPGVDAFFAWLAHHLHGPPVMA